MTQDSRSETQPDQNGVAANPGREIYSGLSVAPDVVDARTAEEIAQDRAADLEALADSRKFLAQERAIIAKIREETGLGVISSTHRGNANDWQLVDDDRAQGRAEVFQAQIDVLEKRLGIVHDQTDEVTLERAS